MHKEENKKGSAQRSFAQTSSNDIIHLIKKNENILSAEEKKQIWENISRKTIGSKRRFIVQTLSIAASILILIVGGWGLNLLTASKTDIYSKLTSSVNVDTLHTTCLYIDEQVVELDKQAEIYCNNEDNQLRIVNRDGNSFKISVPNAKENPYLQIAVPLGNKARIILADKSVITVREQSKLVFPIAYDAKKREVYLEGEAFLNVTKNPQKQFNVKTEDLNISVLGTSFNVSAFPKRNIQSVVLVTGRVNVTPQSGETITMVPNQKYIYDKSGQKNSMSNIDPYNDICWKEDLLVLEKEPLSSVFEKLCKHYNTNLSYDAKEMSKIKISGKLDISIPLDDLLKTIEKIAPTQISVDVKNKTIKINVNPK
jgi:Fe2+-dicitrate sensor, membrane component